MSGLTLHTIEDYKRKVAALEMELSELRRRIDDLDESDDDVGSGDNVYVFDDDDDEARAFDDFYRAYDGTHAKTRRFLLG